MSDLKITELTAFTDPVAADLLCMVDDVAGSPITKKITREDFFNNGLVINEAGASVDFRVEGDTNINALFVKGSNNRVGIGIATPAGTLEVNDTAGDANIYLSTSGTNRGRITGEGGGAVVLRSEAAIYFQSGGNSTRVSILSDGKVGIGKFTPTTNFQVIGNYQLDDSDGSATKSYRFRTSGSALDFDFGGADLSISGFPNADYSGTQKIYMIMGSTFDFVTAYSVWEWKDRAGNNISHSINGDGGVVFNEQGADKDFRIESDTYDAFFVDASADATYIMNSASGKISFFAATPVVKQTSGENLTNNVTSGGTDGTIANFTSLTTYSTDAAAIRNDIYQLARKLKQVNDSLRTYGLLT